MTAISDYSAQRNARIIHESPDACFIARNRELRCIRSDNWCGRFFRWICNLGGAEDRKVNSAVIETLIKVDERISKGIVTFRPFGKTQRISYSHLANAILSSPKFAKSQEIQDLAHQILNHLPAPGSHHSAPKSQGKPDDHIPQATKALRGALGALAQRLPSNPTTAELIKEKFDSVKKNWAMYLDIPKDEIDQDPKMLELTQKVSEELKELEAYI